MKERLTKPSPILHQKPKSNNLHPVFLPKIVKTGGLPENKGHSKVLRTNLQTEKDSSGEDKKGKVFIKHKTTQGPIRDSKMGYFRWVVKFSTNGEDGWIVQKMENTYNETLADGTKRTTGLPTTKYWEAWKVDSDSSITPSLNGNHDYWERGYTYSRAAEGTKGSWSINGTAYFTKKDITKKGFSKGNVLDAKTLIATTSSPGILGKKLLIREQKGSWDATTK